MVLLDALAEVSWKKVGVFAGGFLFGTAGLKVLGSRDAKKCYVQATAAALRAKECVLDAATTIQENAEDVLAAAKEVNAKRAEEVVTDEAAETKTSDSKEA